MNSGETVTPFTNTAVRGFTKKGVVITHVSACKTVYYPFVIIFASILNDDFIIIIIKSVIRIRTSSGFSRSYLVSDYILSFIAEVMIDYFKQLIA